MSLEDDIRGKEFRVEYVKGPRLGQQALVSGHTMLKLRGWVKLIGIEKKEDAGG